MSVFTVHEGGKPGTRVMLAESPWCESKIEVQALELPSGGAFVSMRIPHQDTRWTYFKVESYDDYVTRLRAP